MNNRRRAAIKRWVVGVRVNGGATVVVEARDEKRARRVAEETVADLLSRFSGHVVALKPIRVLGLPTVDPPGRYRARLKGRAD